VIVVSKNRPSRPKEGPFVDQADMVDIEAQGNKYCYGGLQDSYLLRESISTMAEKRIKTVRMYLKNTAARVVDNSSFVEERFSLWAHGERGEYVLHQGGAGKGIHSSRILKSKLKSLAKIIRIGGDTFVTG